MKFLIVTAKITIILTFALWLGLETIRQRAEAAETRGLFISLSDSRIALDKQATDPIIFRSLMLPLTEIAIACLPVTIRA